MNDHIDTTQGSLEAYESCEWLEGGLAFNRRSLHSCLIVHHDSGMPHFADYNGGPLPIEEVIKSRSEILEKQRNGETHDKCKGCAHLEKKKWKRSPYQFNIVGIAHYSHCNIKCNYCFLQTQDPSSFSSGFKPYKIAEQIRHLYDEALLHPDAIIDWGGGEPTIYREFDEIMQLSLERGAFHYLHSNAVRFPEFVETSPYADKIHIICSIDAGLPETYFAMKQQDYLEQVWENLGRYLSAGSIVTAKYIMRDDNFSEENLSAFAIRAEEVGVKDILIDIDYDFPNPSREVITALAHLKHLCLTAGLQVQYGFTGDNFAAENRVVDQIQGAFATRQISAIQSLIRERDYSVSENTAADLEELVKMLFDHCEQKDQALQEKEEMIQQLSAALNSIPPIETASLPIEEKAPQPPQELARPIALEKALILPQEKATAPSLELTEEQTPHPEILPTANAPTVVPAMSKKVEPNPAASVSLAAPAIRVEQAGSVQGMQQETAVDPDAPGMQMRLLGRTGLKVSPVGIGTNQLRITSRAEAIETLHTGFENGINIVHVSADYEGADEIVAEAIRLSDRKVYMAANSYDVHGNTNGPVDHFISHFERTCELLETNRLDLYGIAAVEDREALGENVWGENGMVAFLNRMKAEGRLGHSFCTTHGEPDFIERIVDSDAFDAVMMSYTPLGFHLLSLHPPKGRGFEDLALNRHRLFRKCEEKNIGIMVMMPLAGGLMLDSKAAPPDPIDGAGPQNLEAATILRTILEDPAVSTVMPGTATPVEARENARAGWATGPIAPEQTRALTERIATLRTDMCSRCGACEPLCSRSLPVSWLFRATQIAAQPAESFETWPDVDYFRLHPMGEAPCQDCPDVSCECPYGLDIPASLTKAHNRMLDQAALGQVPLPPGEKMLDRGNGAFAARILRLDLPERCDEGVRLRGRVYLENIGTSPWRNSANGVRLQLLLNGQLAGDVSARIDVQPGARAYFVFESAENCEGALLNLGLQLHAGDLNADHIDLLETSLALPAEREEINTAIRNSLSVSLAHLTRAGSTETSKEVGDYGVEWIAHNLPESWAEETPFCFYLTVRNTGKRRWPHAASAAASVNLVFRLENEVHAIKPLPHDVEPGQTVTLYFMEALPSGLGAWDVSFSFVEQNVAWFHERGVEPLCVLIQRSPALDDHTTRWTDTMHRNNPAYFSPAQGVPRSRTGEPYPTLIAHASGAQITDARGNKWIDYNMGWGSALLGYAHPEIADAVAQATSSGAILSLPHTDEADVTRLLCDLFPCAETVLFGKNGSDACTAAVRAARLHTGKTHILFSGFHGWQYPFAQVFEPALNKAEGDGAAHRFDLNNIEQFMQLVQKYSGNIAAVMVEPAAQAVSVDGPVRSGDVAFLKQIAEIARDQGALLIFDEIMTGFRHRKGSVQTATGITPDLTCFGKALTSGAPLAALVGRRDVLAPALSRLFYHPTFKNDAHAFAAAKAAINIYRRDDVPRKIAEFGSQLRKEITALTEHIGVDASIIGPHYRMLCRFNEPEAGLRKFKRTLLQQELMKRGVMTFRGYMLPSIAHGDEELDLTVKAYHGALEAIQEAEVNNTFASALEILPVE
ncbi:aminotransferase class III-fold pyridoxal phosphate-dependent enzyme [Sulfitobacter sp.]|uniref:aminotransferase class III-fold pyridoxal phosphate-dependent enzyme n=1 Tax=Sulfitobacter sp. TaxID=1903071 RepID=UPI0030026A75